MDKKILRHIALAGLLFAQVTAVNAAYGLKAKTDINFDCNEVCFKTLYGCKYYLVGQCEKHYKITPDIENVQEYCKDVRENKLICKNLCVNMHNEAASYCKKWKKDITKKKK